MRLGRSPWQPRKDANSVVTYKTSATSKATKRYLVRTDVPQAWPWGVEKSPERGRWLDPIALSKRLAEPEALHLGAQAQVSLLCALARLTVRPPWLVPLLVASEANIAEFSGHQLATALYALARLEAKDSVSLQQEGLW
eukprot:g12448.t1